jgi:hypothetical protein
MNRRTTARVAGLAVAILLMPIVVAGRAPASPERVTLAPGEATEVAGGARLRFDAVVNDSRCPSDEQCIRAGSAEVAITIAVDGKASSHRVFAGADPTSVSLDGIVVELQRLDPYPKGARAIDASAYRATFLVRRP